MTDFDPASLLVPRTQSADEGPIIRMAQKAREMRGRGIDVVSLTVGEPDFDTPDNIQAAATAAMKAGFTHYSPVMGIPELRSALSKKLKAENGLDYGPNEICVANGAKQAIANAVLSIIDQGDEVIMLAPFWVSYETAVRFAGGTPVVLHAGVEEDYKVPARRIAEAITPRTKLLILNSPSNPTGAVWTKAELEEIAKVVLAHPRMMVLSDEIYEYILFGSKMVSIGTLPGMRERTITVNGFSKSFAMTGWRLGYAAAVEPIAKAMGRMQGTIVGGRKPVRAARRRRGPRRPARRCRAHAAALSGPTRHGVDGTARHSGREDRRHSSDILRFPRCFGAARQESGQPRDQHDRPHVRLASRRTRRRHCPRHRLRRTGIDPAVIRVQ